MLVVYVFANVQEAPKSVRLDLDFRLQRLWETLTRAHCASIVSTNLCIVLGSQCLCAKAM